MMKKLSFLLVLLSLVFCAHAQIAYRINPESTLTITGTSTIHDWTSKVNSINGELTFNNISKEKNIPAKGKFINNLKIEVPVKSIESPRGPVMDNKTYEALKSEEFPMITFIVRNNDISGIMDKTANKFGLNLTGDLTIAGFTKSVSFPVSGQKLENGSFRFIGDYSFKMTEFNIQPPTAMFGQIVTGDKITLAFNFLVDEIK